MTHTHHNIRFCSKCGQPINSYNIASKFFKKSVEDEVRMTSDLFENCFGKENKK